MLDMYYRRQSSCAAYHAYLVKTTGILTGPFPIFTLTNTEKTGITKNLF